MKITYRCVGGFVHRATGCDLDSDALPPEQAAELEALIQSCHLFDHPVASGVEVHDSPMHFIEVTCGGDTRQVRITAALLPATLRPLVNWLQARSVDLLDSSPEDQQDG